MLGFAVLLLSLSLLTRRHGAFLDIGLLGLLFVFAIQSAMTFSRGGLFAAGLSLVVAGVPVLRERRFRRRLLVGLGVVALVAIIAVVPRLVSYTGGAILARFAETTTTGRAEIVRADLETWSEHPILGVGPGQGKALRARFFRPTASHTEFTRLLAEHGLFGVAALICLLMLVRSALRRPAAPAVQAPRRALLVWSLLFMLVDGMRLAAPAFAFGFPFAEVLTRPYRRRRERVTSWGAGRTGRLPDSLGPFGPQPEKPAHAGGIQ
jgi:O-antigen ligase